VTLGDPSKLAAYMGNSFLRLGSFSFEGLESPEKIAVQSRQRLSVHHLGSGSSVTDSIGSDCETVSFSGVFSGSNATARSQLIDFLRQQGGPLRLVWGSFALDVIISRFQLSFTSDYWIPYRLLCSVTSSSYNGALGPQDILASTPDAQVSGIALLLQDTPITLSSGQIVALTALAGQNHDVAPASLLVEGYGALSAIDSQIGTGSSISSFNTSSAQTSINCIAQDLNILAASSAEQALLMLSRNRLAAILVAALNGNLQ